MCPRTELLAAKQRALLHTFSTSFSVFLSSLGFVPAFLPTGSDSICLYPPFTYTSFFLSCCLSLRQGANVGLQMKQLDFHLRLPGIDMCCSVSGRTLSASPTLSQGRTGRQMKRPQLLTRKQGTEAAIIQLFITHIYYIA